MLQAAKAGALLLALLASIRAASVPDYGAELTGILNPFIGADPPAPTGALGPTTGSWLGGPSNGGADGQWLKEATQRTEEAQREEEEMIAAYQQQYMAAMQQQYTAALEAQEAHAQTGGGPWVGTPFVNGAAVNTLDPAAPMPGVLDLDQYTAAKLIGGPTPIVIQFYVHAGMCPNCAVMSSVMRGLGSQYATEKNIMIAKVDAMAEHQLSARYGEDQMMLPAVLHFKAGSTTPKVYSGSGSKEAMMEYIEQHEDVVKEGQVPELREMVTRFLVSKDKSERDELRKETSAKVNELRSEMVLYGESYVSVMERTLTPSKSERWLKNQKAKLQATRADPSATEVKKQKARRQLNVLEDFDAGLQQAKKVEEGAESIRIAAAEAEAYANRNKAKKAEGRDGNESGDGW
jgi:hypothetical protein